VLTLSGARKTAVPEGHSAHRQERPSFEFSRSYALPAKVDADKTHATLKNGVLTITLEKAPEVKPRQITVRAS
jgi:HSP20 family protein